MSFNNQYLGKTSHRNAPAPAHTISARRVRPSAALALALAAFGFWQPAWAEGPVQSYAILAGSLEDALMEFAAQADLRLIFKTDLVRSARSAGLTGTLTPEQGVARLLEGSGIAYRFVDSNTVTIEPAAPVDPLKALVAEAKTPMDYAGAAEPAPDTPKAPAKKAEEGPTVLPEMTVTAKPTDETSYNVLDATTATKTDTPLLQTPASVQVITRQQLQDRQVFTPAEALRYTSGITPAAGGRSQFDPAFTIRGFNNIDTSAVLGSYYYRDGARLTAVPISVGNLDRIEVLKGPATVLYGRAEPGGLINVVYKRPLDTPNYLLEQQAGNYDFFRTIVDATGPVTQDDSLLYRFGLQYIDTGSFRDFINDNLLSVAPSLTWNISERTQVNLQFEYSHAETSKPSGIPAIGTRPAPVPLSRFIGDSFGDSPDQVSDDYVVDLGINHRFNPDWALKWNFLYANQQLDLEGILRIANLNEATGQSTRASIFAEPFDDRRWYFTSLNLTGNVPVLGMRHKLLFGFDYMNDRLPAPFFNPVFDHQFNIFNPVYGVLPRPSVAELQTDPRFANGVFPFFLGSNEWYGIYIQDQIEVTDQLHLVLGGRYDNAEALLTIDPAQEPRHDTALSPRYGIVYQPWPWLSAYFQYVESFGQANTAFAQGGQQFDPQRGEQFEGGFKAEFFSGRLSSTLAFFHLTKSNLVTADPNNPNSPFSLAIGEGRSQGIEFDVAGAVTDRLSLIGSYAYLDTEITEDGTRDAAGNLSRLGKHLPNAPRHAGSLWGTYALSDRFKVGTGVVVVGERQGDFENTYQLPGYARVDAMAAYTWELGGSRLTAQLNINNLLDKEHFTHTTETRVEGAFPGEPLTVIGALRLEY